MPKNTQENVFKLGDSVTAYEAEKYIVDLTNFVSELSADVPAIIDATEIEVIDTAGCQLIDIAMVIARKRAAKLECQFSAPVESAFKALGLEEAV